MQYDEAGLAASVSVTISKSVAVVVCWSVVRAQSEDELYSLCQQAQYLRSSRDEKEEIQK